MDSNQSLTRLFKKEVFRYDTPNFDLENGSMEEVHPDKVMSVITTNFGSPPVSETSPMGGDVKPLFGEIVIQPPLSLSSQKGTFKSPVFQKHPMEQNVRVMINYKGYVGVFEFDEKENLFFGRVVDSEDLITFQGSTLENTKFAFQDAINEHIRWCETYRKAPPLKSR